MSEIPLAHKYSAETYNQALDNLVQRWEREDGEGPIKYHEAAIGMDKSTVSVALKFLGEIGLLETPKAGNYNVSEEVVDYVTKIGEVKREAKREVEGRLEDYPLYREAVFMIGVNDFTLDELTEEVAGSSEVAASEDEVTDVKRSLKVLAELGFLEINEEDGTVSVPEDLSEETPEEEVGREATETEAESAEPGAEAVSGEPGTAAEGQSTEGHYANGSGVAVLEEQQQQPGPQREPAARSRVTLEVDLDISMDATDMEPKEVRDKLEAIDGVLGEDGE